MYLSVYKPSKLVMSLLKQINKTNGKFIYFVTFIISVINLNCCIIIIIDLCKNIKCRENARLL